MAKAFGHAQGDDVQLIGLEGPFQVEKTRNSAHSHTGSFANGRDAYRFKIFTMEPRDNTASNRSRPSITSLLGRRSSVKKPMEFPCDKAKEIPMSKRIVIAAVLIAIATPALAEDFYVGQDPKSKRCKIVTEKPDGQTMIMIGTGAYPTKEEAKAAKKAAAECPKKESAN
jgi:hypothetical protein